MPLTDLPTRIITIELSDAGGILRPNARLTFTLSAPDVDAVAGRAVTIDPIEVHLTEDGAEVALWPPSRGTAGTYYIVSASVAGMMRVIGTVQPNDVDGQGLGELLAVDIPEAEGFYTILPTADFDALTDQIDAAEASTLAASEAAAAASAEAQAARDAAGLAAMTVGAYTAATLAEAVAAGLAAVTDGQTYTATGEDVTYAGVYVREAGPVATLIAAIPRVEGIRPEMAGIIAAEDDAGTVVSVVDAGGFVVATLGAVGLVGAAYAIGPDALTTNVVAVSTDESFTGAYLTDSAGFYIDPALAGASVKTPLPLWTDGRSLAYARARLAGLLVGTAQTVRIAVTGDSWTERTVIPQALADLLYTAYGRGADGWVQPWVNQHLNAVAVVRSGWTIRDVTGADAAPFGPDGLGGDCATTAGTLAITGVKAATLTLYYRDTTGTFRWQIDGGAWTTVTGTGGNGAAKSIVTGLDPDTLHTIDVDTTGNTGTATIYGIHASGIDGAEMLKMGNSSSVASQMASVSGTAEADFVLADLAPEMVVIILGTNDTSNGVSGADYGAALVAMMLDWTSHVAGSAAVLVAPPYNDRASATVPMTVYADAIVDIYAAEACEYLDLARLWAGFAVMDSGGAWLDDAHVSETGARLIAGDIWRKFMEIE